MNKRKGTLKNGDMPVSALDVFGKVRKDYRDALEECLNSEDNLPSHKTYSSSYIKKGRFGLSFLNVKEDEMEGDYELEEWEVTPKDLSKYHDEPEKILEEFNMAYERAKEEAQGEVLARETELEKYS